MSFRCVRPGFEHGVHISKFESFLQGTLNGSVRRYSEVANASDASTGRMALTTV